MIVAAVRISLVAFLISTVPLVASAQDSRLDARLSGTETVPLATGKARHDVKGTNTKLTVDGNGLKSYEGQTVRILVNFSEVGTDIVKGGKINLKLDSNKGQTVPNINPGDTVTVVAGDGEVQITILEGQFPGGGGGGVGVGGELVCRVAPPTRLSQHDYHEKSNCRDGGASRHTQRSSANSRRRFL